MIAVEIRLRGRFWGQSHARFSSKFDIVVHDSLAPGIDKYPTFASTMRFGMQLDGIMRLLLSIVTQMIHISQVLHPNI